MVTVLCHLCVISAQLDDKMFSPPNNEQTTGREYGKQKYGSPHLKNSLTKLFLPCILYQSEDHLRCRLGGLSSESGHFSLHMGLLQTCWATIYLFKIKFVEYLSHFMTFRFIAALVEQTIVRCSYGRPLKQRALFDGRKAILRMSRSYLAIRTCTTVAELTCERHEKYLEHVSGMQTPLLY